MIYELIQFGGVLFWLIAAFVTLVVAAQMSDAKFGWATATLVVFLVATLAFTNSNILQWIEANPGRTALYVAGYLGVGVAWSVFKWYLLVRDTDRRYIGLRETWLKGKNLATMPLDNVSRNEFRKFRENKLNIGYKSFPLRVSEFKSSVVAWMAYWPFSIAAFVLGDLVQRVFSSLYGAISGLLQGISNRVSSRHAELEGE